MTKDEKIVYELEKLGLTIKEAEIYLELVKNPNVNGSKIAKTLGYPRTSVYPVLQKLQERGCAYSVTEGDVTSYTALEPEKLLKKLRREFSQAAENLEKEFENFEISNSQKEFLTINGFEGVKERVHIILKEAKEEVYINSNFDLDSIGLVAEDLRKLTAEGVRVIFFSFEGIKTKKNGIEYYSRNLTREKYYNELKRLFIVADMEVAIIASGDDRYFNGVFSQNKLLINLIAEHIHNDIYITKLEELYDINWKKIKIGSKQEIDIKGK